ncbi:MAG: hypothetical protein Q3996_00825 [Candidatus Saccharibacteria bacterium]|nr:hypothetical protein [Candidatus Saccharibacteria bacterium]
MISHTINKKGVVSIFVVIFTTLLITVVAMSFIRLMLLDQQRAINSDLANSAYDSALTGVEEAKRALIEYERSVCKDKNSSDCEQKTNKYLRGNHCGAVQGIMGGDTTAVDNEVLIKSSSVNDIKLDQAYTCVKIKYFTDDYVRDFDGSAGEQIMLPLNFTNKTQKMTLRWHDKTKDKDDKDPIDTNLLTIFNKASDKPIWGASWNSVPPTLMIQYVEAGNNDMPTAYLRPSKNGSVVTFSRGEPILSKDKQAPVFAVNCNSTSDQPYYCNTTLEFPEEIKAGERNKFLKITKIYGDKTTLNFGFSDDQDIAFNGIQPEIDSTGRANYIVRRVKARVEFTTGKFPFPNAALNVSNNLDKKFEVTEQKVKK